MKSSNDKVLSHIVRRALSGEGAHAGTQNAFDGLDWKIAAIRPPGVPHSIFQLLAHTNYWQPWVLQWLNGKDPTVPRHAAGSWPNNPSPASPDRWKRAVRNFRGSCTSWRVDRARAISSEQLARPVVYGCSIPSPPTLATTLGRLSS